MIRALDWQAQQRQAAAEPSIVSLADQCRAAALEVLGARDWQKPQLAAWLRGSYARVALSVRDADEPAPSSARAVRAESVSDLLARTRAEVQATLRDSMKNEWLFAERLLAAGLVAHTRSKTGTALFVPLDRKRLRLVDRVLSLLAVDYLARPDDYFTKLSVCATCGAIDFGARCLQHAAAAPRLERGARSARAPRLELVVDPRPLRLELVVDPAE